MRQEGRAVSGFDFLEGIGNCVNGITFVATRKIATCCEAFAHVLSNHGAVDFGIGTFIPNDGKLSQGIFGAPPSVGHDSHCRGIHPNNSFHAAQCFDLAVVKANKLATKHGAIHHGRAQHAIHLQIDAIDLLAIDLVGRVQTFD